MKIFRSLAAGGVGWGLLVFFCSVPVSAETPAPAAPAESLPDQARLENFLQRVFDIMDEHYYLRVSKKVHEKFLQVYTAEKLREINDRAQKTEDFVHLGAGLLVNKLKAPEDKFTNFIPPRKAKEFKNKAYAVTQDLGLEGEKTKEGFLITKVQKHSQAYSENIRPGDLLLKIDGRSVAALKEEAILKKLAPEIGARVRLRLKSAATGLIREVTLESKTYFQETVFTIPTDAPKTLALRITHFNQKTHEDFSEALENFPVETIGHLVIDLRDNEGGPPLAAREILGFFLPVNDHLFAIARKGKSPFMMAAPKQPIAYQGPISVLVNEKTGSAAEMMSGVLQAKRLARLYGQQTAGATYLKGLFDLEDQSTIFMVTSLTFFYNKAVFPADGLVPDAVLQKNQDALEFAVQQYPSS